jgi:hypothetical protein
MIPRPIRGLIDRLSGWAGPPAGMSYPPLDVLKRVADDLWVVDSVIGREAPVRMTVIRLPAGDLVLHSPTRFTDQLRRQLEGIGRIRHLVAPNIAHWTFLPGWQGAVPAAVTWAAPGLRDRSKVRRSGVRLDHDLTDAPPPDWAAEIEQAVIRGGAGFTEVAMFHKPTRTLLLTDLVVNLEAAKVPVSLRPLARLLGVLAPDGRAPAYLRGLVKLGRRDKASAVARLLHWYPERVIFTHGRWFDRDGEAQLRRSLRWLLR